MSSSDVDTVFISLACAVCFGFGAALGVLLGSLLKGNSEFRKAEAEIDRKQKELEASIARGCWQDDNRRL